MKLDYSDCKNNKYGTLTDDRGVNYQLTDEATETDRVLTHDDDTHIELRAPAVSDGHEYNIYWIFEKNEGWTLDEYNYEEVDRIVKA